MRKFFLPVSFVCSILILFYACRKTDATDSVVEPEKAPVQNTRFFNVPASAVPQIKAIAEAIKKQDAKYKFVNDVIKKAGYPRWDKVKIFNNASRTVSGRNSSASDSIPEEVVYVPFVLDSGKTTNAVLSVALDQSDTTYRMAYAGNYRAAGYDTATAGWNARKMFSLFAGFDYTVFGHTKFVIRDTLLVAPPTKGMRMVATLANHHGQAVTARSASWFNCHWWDLCPKPTVQDVPQSVRATNDCPGGFRLELCFPISGGSSGGGSTGTGSGNPGGPGGGPANYGWAGTGSGNADQYTVGGGSGTTAGWWSGGGSGPCHQPTNQRGTATATANCGPGWTPVVGSYDQQNINTLSNLLSQNPNYLVNPCLFLSQYVYLTTFQAPQSVTDRLNLINQLYINSPNPQYVQSPTYLQNINDASSALINFDYFPIHINTLPILNNVQMTPQQLFEYFRQNWNQFIDTGIASFYPYQDAVVNDDSLWRSPNPFSSMLHLDMDFDGSVIVSSYTSTTNMAQMVATTVRTPLDGLHPVSGNRSWGIDVDPNGGYFFYTTATDRITGMVPTVLNTWADRIGAVSGFDKADSLWKSLQTKMIQFIKNHGGQAELYNPMQPGYILRPKWMDIDLFLKNQISLDELKRRIGC